MTSRTIVHKSISITILKNDLHTVEYNSPMEDIDFHQAFIAKNSVVKVMDNILKSSAISQKRES